MVTSVKKVGLLGALAALCVAITLALCACGGGQNASSNSGLSSSGDTAAQKTAPAKEEEPLPESTIDYSWEELSKISQEIAGAGSNDEAIEIAKGYGLTTPEGKLDGTQTKSFRLSDGKPAQVTIAGFNHDERNDAPGKAGITFIFTTTLGINSMNVNTKGRGEVGWIDTTIRRNLDSTYMDKMPEDLRDVMVPVYKKTNNEGDSTDKSAVTQTIDTLWLFSLAEVVGAGTDKGMVKKGHITILDSEGYQYQLFKDAGVTDMTTYKQTPAEAQKVTARQYDGKDCGWWTRSPYPSEIISGYWYIVSNGAIELYGAADYDDFKGVVPGFCI